MKGIFATVAIMALLCGVMASDIKDELNRKVCVSKTCLYRCRINTASRIR